MKDFGRWLVETRGGRLVFRLVALSFVAGLAYLLVHEEVGRQTSEITKRVQVIESADPCVMLSQAAEDGAGRKVVRRLTRACTGFLDGLGPLISQRLACDILEEGAYPCPRPESAAAVAIEEHEGEGDAFQPASAAQPSEPPTGGDTGGSPPQGDKAPVADQPDSTGTPPPAAAAPSETPADQPPPPAAAGPESSSSPVDEIEDTVKSVIDAVCDLTDRLQHRC